MVIDPYSKGFSPVLRCSSLHKNQHFKIPLRSGIREPRVSQSYDFYVLPSLNKIYLFIYLFIYYFFSRSVETLRNKLQVLRLVALTIMIGDGQSQFLFQMFAKKCWNS